MKHTVKYKSSSKVVAAKAPYQVNELIKEIQDTVYDVASKYLKAEGWDTSDIADYFRVDVSETEPEVIRAEIRGELHYEELSELCSQLDKVIAVKFDRDAYFEPVEPGIAEAFIRTGVEACSNVTASLDEDLVFIDNKKSSIVNNDPSLDPGFDEYDIYSPEDLEKDADYDVTASLNYVTPEMKQLKRAISKIYVDNDDQFHELVNSLLSNEPINLVPETRALKRAIDSLVVDSEEEKRTLVYEVAKDLGVINSSSNVDVYCADADDQIEDGWGTDVRGILDIPFARAEDLMYEIRNTIRGAYTDCETVEDLADYIRQLASEFEEAADELESL